MKKLFFGVYNPSIILTYISVFCSLYGISQLMRAENVTTVLPLAMLLLIIAGICDMFDGAVARKCKRTEKEKEFGIQLDSLADTVSFVVYPATILIGTTAYNPVSITIAMVYAFTGIMRLGWFNVTTEENKGFFMGLPVTTAALIFPLVFCVCHLTGIYFTNLIAQITWTLVALLFIGNFKLKKPSIKWALNALPVAIVMIITLISMM